MSECLFVLIVDACPILYSPSFLGEGSPGRVGQKNGPEVKYGNPIDTESNILFIEISVEKYPFQIFGVLTTRLSQG